MSSDDAPSTARFGESSGRGGSTEVSSIVSNLAMVAEVPPSSRTSIMASSASSGGGGEEEEGPGRSRSPARSVAGGVSPRSLPAASEASTYTSRSYQLVPSNAAGSMSTPSPRVMVNQQINVAVNPDADRKLAVMQEVMGQLSIVIRD